MPAFRRIGTMFARRLLPAVLLLCLCAACSAPLEQAFHPATDSPHLRHDVLHTGDGADLPLRIWLPEGEIEAVLIGVHGFNDYSNAFAGPGEYFLRRGIALFAYDQRGFGQTKQHGIWAGRENLAQDLEQMVRAVGQKYPGLPIYLLGESMGGAVVIAAMAEKELPGVRGAIMTAPAVWGDETMNAFYRTTLWVMAHTVPGAEMTGEDLKILASDNIEMLRALGRDPHIIKSTRIDAIYGIVGLMDYAYTHVEQATLPLLLLYGAHDQVIPREPVKKAIKKLSAPYRVAYYPDGYHLLLRDLKSDIVLGDIVSWVKNPDQPLPSGYDQRWEERFDSYHY